MSFTSEFRDFVSKGNVVDLAVGVVIGGAFGKIIDSLVSDILMPPIGVLIGGVDFKELKMPIKSAIIDAAGKVTSPEVTVNYGNFIQSAIVFLIVALAIFVFVVKPMNAMNARMAKPAPAGPPPPTKEEILLTEIRDLLKK